MDACRYQMRKCRNGGWVEAAARYLLESLYLTSELLPVHKDPFDRLLVAQARTHSYALVSPDACFRKYGLQVIW
jgi:PIN domain nuclease of toxin-antitoxin system